MKKFIGHEEWAAPLDIDTQLTIILEFYLWFIVEFDFWFLNLPAIKQKTRVCPISQWVFIPKIVCGRHSFERGKLLSLAYVIKSIDES